VSALLMGAVLEVGFRFFAGTFLEYAGERPVVVILLLLFVHGVLVATWSFVVIVGLGLAVRRLYLLRSEPLPLFQQESLEATPVPEKQAPPWKWGLGILLLVLSLVAPLVLWLDLSRYTRPRPQVLVTAHRGHARAAPENTLSAIRKAIASGADY